MVDDSQDYELLDAFEDGESTTLTFRRPIDTCDIDKDVLIDVSSNTKYTKFLFCTLGHQMTQFEYNCYRAIG